MNWQNFFEKEKKEEYFMKLMEQLENEYKQKTVYPPREDLFSIFKYCPYEDVKVVILGQDPYHQPNQAHGLAFSVRKGIKIPPSLRNIYKELKSDLDISAPSHGNLEPWARQGVFLMNAIMSVEAGKAGSHRKLGWEKFSNHVMEVLDQHEQPIVFVLWGNWAREKASLLHNPKHLILCAPHPSPLSAYQGFFDTKPFSTINTFLIEHDRSPINWKIEE